MDDKQELLRSMAYEDVEYDQVFDRDDFDTFREMMADQGYQISEQDLEDYYNYVEEAKGLTESVETNICVICNHEYDGYGNSAEPIAKGYCCDKCNMEKVIPARLSQVTGLKESNDTMEQRFQQFKKDVADDNIGGQFGYDWYEDIVNNAYGDALAEYDDVELEPSVQAGRGGIFAYIDGHDCGYVQDFEAECEELYQLACESDTYEEFKQSVQGYVDRLVEYACEQLPEEEENLDESLDTARIKAQELRKNSDADVILYAYRDKKGNLVELEPEELTMDEYQERVKQITDEQTKLSDKDPRGNRYGHERDMMFYALYKRAVTESVAVEPKDNGYHDLWELSDSYAVHNDGGRFYVFDRDNGNNHLFISDSIDEVNSYIKDELNLDVVIKPSTRVFKKRSIPSKKDIQKDKYLRDTAQIAWESGHGYDPDDFSYFKKVCKEDGYNVTEDDFAKYFEYLDEIRSEQYNLGEARLTDKDKLEREIEQLDIKATEFEKLSKDSFDKGNEEGGYYYKELADEIRREMDMKLATRSHSIEEDMNGEYVVMGVTTAGNKVYYNADTREWLDKADDATIFTDMDIARDTWSVVTNNGRKLPDGFRRIFVPNYNKQIMNESSETRWNIGSNKVVPFGSDEHLKLIDLAQMLEDNSPNGYKYEVKQTYEDFGANMQWTTIICSDRRGDTWQVLNTKEWLDLANGKSVEEVYNEVVSGQYFQDKEKDYDNMNMGEIFDSLD